MAELPPNINYHVRQLQEKAENRLAKIADEATQIKIQLALYKRVLNGDASLDAWLQYEASQKDMR